MTKLFVWNGMILFSTHARKLELEDFGKRLIRYTIMPKASWIWNIFSWKNLQIFRNCRDFGQWPYYVSNSSAWRRNQTIYIHFHLRNQYRCADDTIAKWACPTYFNRCKCFNCVRRKYDRNGDVISKNQLGLGLMKKLTFTEAHTHT